jgi:hypothetical protein
MQIDRHFASPGPAKGKHFIALADEERTVFDADPTTSPKKDGASSARPSSRTTRRKKSPRKSAAA